MAKKKATKKKTKKKAPKKKKEVKKVEEEVVEVEQEAPEMEEAPVEEVEEVKEEKVEEKESKEEPSSPPSPAETKSEKRMRLSILLLSMVCVLLWAALLYLLNQTYMINDNYAELITKVDTLTTIYEGNVDEEDVDEMEKDMDEEKDDDDMDDSDEEDSDEDSDEVTLMEETFECDHPYSGGTEPTGSMIIRYPEGATLEDVSLPENPLTCMLELKYKTGTLYFKYSNGEAYPTDLDPAFTVLKTEGDQIMGRDPLVFYPASEMYPEAGYRTSYDMKMDDSDCPVDDEIWGPMDPPCGTPGNQFVTYLGSSYVEITEGTSEADRDEILEMFDIVNVESEGGPY